MSKLSKILCAAGSVFLFSGCVSVDKEFALSVKTATDLILPEYQSYVQNDPSLDSDSKSVRDRLAEELKSLLDEASK